MEEVRKEVFKRRKLARSKTPEKCPQKRGDTQARTSRRKAEHKHYFSDLAQLDP